jgi:hypothetical protein
MTGPTPMRGAIPRKLIPATSRVVPSGPLDKLDAALSILQAVILARDTNYNAAFVLGRAPNLDEALIHAARLLGDASDTLEDFAELLPVDAGGAA